jgi:predicted small secreted protein
MRIRGRQRAFSGCNRKDFTMRKILLSMSAWLALAAAMPLLSACHTMAGAGQDISNTGNALTNSADQHTP